MDWYEAQFPLHATPTNLFYRTARVVAVVFPLDQTLGDVPTQLSNSAAYLITWPTNPRPHLTPQE